MRLFDERGYDATSVSDLALRRGPARSAPHHFSSTEELSSLRVRLGGSRDLAD